MADLSSLKLDLIQRLTALLPETRSFGCKRCLYRYGGVNVADNVRICSSVKVLGNGSLTIGTNTWIGHQTLIIASAGVTIGSFVDIAPRVFIGTGTHEIDAEGSHSAGIGKSLPITIEDGVWIGAGAMILPGFKIGKKAVIAAGAVVAADIPPYALAAGVPAKVIRDIRDKPCT